MPEYEIQLEAEATAVVWLTIKAENREAAMDQAMNQAEAARWEIYHLQNSTVKITGAFSEEDPDDDSYFEKQLILAIKQRPIA